MLPRHVNNKSENLFTLDTLLQHSTTLVLERHGSLVAKLLAVYVIFDYSFNFASGI